MGKFWPRASVQIGAWALGGLATSALAQSWPARNVTIVTSFAAGSVTDLTARIIGAALQEALGRTFIVENKPGAGGMIAAQYVAEWSLYGEGRATRMGAGPQQLDGGADGQDDR